MHFMFSRQEQHLIVNFSDCSCQSGEHRGLAKLGNNVAETLLRRQMFPSLAAWETYVAETNFAARKQKIVFA